MNNHSFQRPTVVSEDIWTAARKELLREEKELTRLHDKIAAKRRELPWVKVDKAYSFDSPGGPVSLADLFAGRNQLAVYHFMLGPGWEEGCKSCSFIADHLVPTIPHLRARDVTLAVVSRAPLAEILPFKERMGWSFNWVSSNRNDFNFNYHVSFTEEEMARDTVYYNYGLMGFPHEEAPGFSVFAKAADGCVYHTYSTYGRGVEQFMGTYTILDLMPKGRDEDPVEPGMDWVRHHDRYDQPVDAVAAR